MRVWTTLPVISLKFPLELDAELGEAVYEAVLANEEKEEGVGIQGTTPNFQGESLLYSYVWPVFLWS